jgi:carboxylesterase
MAFVVCVHGLGGSASTMSPVVAALRAAGHEAIAVTLPGHGTQPHDLRATGWHHWLDAIPTADVLVGQSMGAALVLAAAAERHEVRAVVCINPPARDPDALDGLEWRRSRGHEWVDAPPAADGEQAYDRLPIDALAAMAAGVAATDLAAVDRPVLIVTSADDDVVDPACSDAVAAALTGPVTRLVLAHGGHTATLGPQRDELADAVVDFVGSLEGPAVS